MKCQISYSFNLDEPGERDYMESLIKYETHERKLEALYEQFRKIAKYGSFPPTLEELDSDSKEAIYKFIEYLREFLHEA